ncbi:MAG: ribonuclease HI family protein [Candidatus Omnitrophica bacterium]|nr:ribonuclease HI family protein [Candidatus Omnitrophota bacterium]
MSSKITIYSDGGARGNPGPAAIGVLLCDEKGNIFQEYSETIGETTNNVAEYSAVLKGLDLALEAGAKAIDYFVDSELVQRQLTGVYRVKTPHIRELFLKVKEKEKNFETIRFQHVPREHEKLRRADKLVNEALNRAGF